VVDFEKFTTLLVIVLEGYLDCAVFVSFSISVHIKRVRKLAVCVGCSRSCFL